MCIGAYLSGLPDSRNRYGASPVVAVGPICSFGEHAVTGIGTYQESNRGVTDLKGVTKIDK